MKKIAMCCSQILFLLLPMVSFAHEEFNFVYVCSVTNKNAEGLFRDVVNVVFMPEWQKKSHLYEDDQKSIWFEVAPVIDVMGKIESYQMVMELYVNKSVKPTVTFHGPEFSEVGFEHDELNIGAHCFHRSQRGN